MKMPPAVMMGKLIKFPIFFERVWGAIQSTDTPYEKVRMSVIEIFRTAMKSHPTTEVDDVIALYLEAIAYMFPNQAKDIPGIIVTLPFRDFESFGQGIVVGFLAIANSPENKLTNPDFERAMFAFFQELLFLHCAVESLISLKGRGTLSNYLGVFIEGAWTVSGTGLLKEWRNLRKQRLLETLLCFERKYDEHLKSFQLTQERRDNMLLRVLIDESWVKTVLVVPREMRTSLISRLYEMTLTSRSSAVS